jgi:hypothetical protein
MKLNIVSEVDKVTHAILKARVVLDEYV